MRPVNLIPPEERGGKAPVRTGPIAYLLIGALALALAAVTMLVLTNNQISDRKAEIASLDQQLVAVQQRAAELAPFSSFASVEAARTATVKNLANSRFDWERVLRELALVIPSDVQLTELTGSTATGGSVTSGSTAGVSSPSLTMAGCTMGQEGVARFLSALRDIDGVTRVGLTSSERPTDETAGSGGGGGESGAGDTECATSDAIARFDVVVAFDGAPNPAVPGAAPAAPATTTPPPATAPAGTETTPASQTAPTGGGT
jgi:Tfp pilus assembly protein PilN